MHLPRSKSLFHAKTSDLTKAIDWALAENTREGSPYFECIDQKQVAVDWLNWQLRGDSKTAARFVGEQCGLCTD